MSNIQGTMQHLIQTLNDTQPPVVSAPYTPHNPYNPCPDTHINTILGTLPYSSPIPPCTNTQSTPQSASALMSTVPLTPIRAWPTTHNPAIPTPPTPSPIPNPPPAYPPPQLSVNQTNPFIIQQGNQCVTSNPFIGSFSNANPFLYSNTTPVSHDIPILRPKDVSLLKLAELKGVVADNRLNTFFRQVESCTGSDDKRIEVAMARAEQNIATFLAAEIQNNGNNLSWSEIKRLMKQQFIGAATLLQAWQEITAMTYYFDEPPSSFVNKLQCKISALTLKFPNDPIPTSDKFLKTKIYKGLNSQVQVELVDFLADHIPLKNFMAYAEEEYYRAQGIILSNNNRVLPISGAESSQSPIPVRNTPPVGTPCNEIEKLTRKLNELNKKIEKVSMTRQNNIKKYCAFCKVATHNLSDCPYSPPKGVCFDFHQPNVRRGHVGCPGQLGGDSSL
ncbi:uncharacterized protein [Palaemon carinicauda]|uniref:uncharacterized protein n=1 Tax=Palaemon carinicauda TaxID=392227 RepID=UPI0035B632BE